MIIEERGKVTAIDIANSFHPMKPSEALGILNQLIQSGFICKDDSGDKFVFIWS